MRKLVSDFKENGLWVKNKGYSINPVITLACRTWSGMNTRCNPDGNHQKMEPTYIGCTMSENFKDFQYFRDKIDPRVYTALMNYEVEITD